MRKMETCGIIVSRLLSKASSKFKDGGWTLLQRTPSVWSSSKSILDKLGQVQHPEGPRLLIVNSSVKSHSVWKVRKDTYTRRMNALQRQYAVIIKI
jgi:hypothetical protein